MLNFSIAGKGGRPSSKEAPVTDGYGLPAVAGLRLSGAMIRYELQPTDVGDFLPVCCLVLLFLCSEKEGTLQISVVSGIEDHL